LESSVEDANGEPDVSAGGIDVGKRSAVPGNRKTPVTAAS
jgi:SAGA-associated factor 73